MGVFCPVFPGRSGVATATAAGRQGSDSPGWRVSSVRNQAPPRVHESGWKSLGDKMRQYRHRVKGSLPGHEENIPGTVCLEKSTAPQGNGNKTGQPARQRKMQKADIVHLHRLPDGPEKAKQLKALEEKVGEKRKAGCLPLVPRSGQRHLENGHNGEVSLVMPGYGGKIGVLKQPVVDPESGKIKEDTVEWLVEEADFLKQLSHKHIVRVLSDKCDETDNESGEKSRETLLVTKLAGSANLEQLKKLALSEVITRNNDNAQVDLPVDAQNSSSCLLPVELLQRIMVQVASALDYLHKEKEMMHGNVATRNIVIAPDGHVSLCDFGSAVKIDDNRLAPEAWLAYFGSWDSWSLGAVLYELAFGYVQVKAADPVLKDLMKGETLESHLDEKIEGISSSRSRKGLSPQQARDLKDLLMKLLQSDPWGRISMENALEHPFLREAAQKAEDAAKREAEQRAARQREAARRVGDSWQP